jgi:L-threonylcarbamoyladenylate synthase
MSNQQWKMHRVFREMTQLVELDPKHPVCEAIERAAAIIRSGGLVAFPTETVYGLGANAMNEIAVRKIFEAKGRPADNPLIVHVGGREMLDVVATGVEEKAERLIEGFWPGPLTLVLNRTSEVAQSVSAGLPTIAVRMPRNKIALALIRASNTPIAAPSANWSGRPSPTTASHVLEDLGGKIEMILDGGVTKIGIESTVLDVTHDPPVILRPGWITQETLSDAIGRVERATSDDELRRSPGTRHRHYSPRARVVLVERTLYEKLATLTESYLADAKVGFVGHTPLVLDSPNFKAIILGNSAEGYARSIYSAFRELDAFGARVIVVEGIEDAGEGVAVMDRLRRAASETTR